MSSLFPNPRPPDSERDESAEPEQAWANIQPSELASLRRRSKSRRLAKPGESEPLTGAQRLLLLDTWRRSSLPAGDFAALVGISKHTLYAWKHKFETDGPAGLEDKPRGGPTGSRLPEVTKRAIL